MAKNMSKLIPKMRKDDIDHICRGLKIDLPQLILTDRKKVLRFVKDHGPFCVWDLIEPKWQGALWAWAEYTLLISLVVLATAIIVGIGIGVLYLIQVVSYAFALLVIPFVALIPVGFKWLLGDLYR